MPKRATAPYVGDLKRNRKVVYNSRDQSLQVVARQMPWQAKKPVCVGIG